MTSIFELDQIKNAVQNIDMDNIIASIAEGFVAYSRGRVVVPPVGEMLFDNPPGETHIKYGYIIDDDFYVIKIASGFYPGGQGVTAHGSGLMILFSQKSGDPVGIFMDNGYLTNVRTAAAGAVVARCMAPRQIDRIGIIGAGIQGRLQLEYLMPITPCREVMVWGLTDAELRTYKEDMQELGFKVVTTMDIDRVAESCNLIVTATPSTEPLLSAEQIKKGTHITAMGSDTPKKQELEPSILAGADVVVCDSLEQSRLRGEVFHAREAGLIEDNKVIELGNALADSTLVRADDSQITIADLTGVAVQDIQICKSVFQALNA
jgi:ornithine cyclodeaminase